MLTYETLGYYGSVSKIYRSKEEYSIKNRQKHIQYNNLFKIFIKQIQNFTFPSTYSNNPFDVKRTNELNDCNYKLHFHRM